MASTLIRSGLTLLAILAFPFSTLRADDLCRARGSAGVEAFASEARDAKLNPEGAFFKDASGRLGFAELDGTCRAASFEVSVDIRAERLDSSAGSQGYRGESLMVLREAYLSGDAGDGLVFDAGKKDVRNGYMFFFSPMDVLYNPIEFPGGGVSRVHGVSWRDGYREGSWLLQGTGFTSWGSWEVAYLPRLSRKSHEPIGEWSSLQRTNGYHRVYLAAGLNLFEDFNPRAVAVVGEENKFAVGVSGFLSDDLVLNAELAVHDSAEVGFVDKFLVGSFEQGLFPDPDRIFIKQGRDLYSQFSAGIRYSSAQRLDISLEYFFQEQGYSGSRWGDYFNFLDVSDRYHRATGVSDFLGYTLVMAGQADDLFRRDAVLGRHYLSMHVSRSPGLGGFGWETSAVINAEDLSYSVALHVFSRFRSNFEIYLGGSYLGGSELSEFGRFGDDGVVYAGIRSVW